MCAKIIILLVFIGSFLRSAESIHFCYNDPKCSPSTWQGLCKTGRHQSPIDLPTSTPITSESIDMSFSEEYSHDHLDWFISNNGSKVLFQFHENATSHLYFEVDDVGPIYRFAQAHFHWGEDDAKGSEHTIDGVQKSLELHLVHFVAEKGINSIEEALVNAKNKKIALGVIAVLFEVDPNATDPNPTLDTIIQKLEKPSIDTRTPIKVSNAPINLLSLIPAEPAQIFRYEGSLTTPNCDEKVLWTVFKEPMKITPDQMARFRELVKDEDGKPLKSNCRPVQPLVDRPLILSPATMTVKEISMNESVPITSAPHFDSTVSSGPHGQSPSLKGHLIPLNLIILTIWKYTRN